MTIELAVALPVLIIVAAIAMNALTFFHDCAVFDRVAHEAVRTHATSPAYGEGIGQCSARVEQDIRAQLDASNLNVSVAHGTAGIDYDAYTATLEYSPTLFGRSLTSSVFGVSMPTMTHTATYVVNRYKPGVIA